MFQPSRMEKDKNFFFGFYPEFVPKVSINKKKKKRNQTMSQGPKKVWSFYVIKKSIMEFIWMHITCTHIPFFL